ncbi:outer membrane protein [Celerinatantimonas sp. MCCC 1A17872]|uniref:outer membrane protein n=1 Tax=Celerinatantimonas sp. MCCC 1A17872 TaxID=3177514 RepID=UPI0038C6B544
MKKLILSSMLLLSASASAATMPTGFYAKLGFGQSYGADQDYNLKDSYDTSVTVHDGLDFKHSDSYELAVGYRYPQLSWLTTELALNYNSKLKLTGSSITSGTVTYDEASKLNIKSTTLMLSGQIDMASLFGQDDWMFHPYVGLGIGVSRNKLNNFKLYSSDGSSSVTLNNGDTRTDFAWQTKLGVTYAATDHIVLDLSYAYNDYGKVKSKTTDYSSSETIYATEMDYHTQQIMLDMRYFF